MHLPKPTRRRVLGRLAWPLAAAALAGCAGFPGAPTRYRISAAQLEESLRERVPLRHSMGGIVEVTARVDGLRMLPEREQVAAQVKFESSGPLLPQSFHGSFDLLFGLRWEPSDHSLRAHQLELRSLRLPMVVGRSAQLLEAALTAVSRQLIGDVVLHRLSPREVQRLRGWGLRPDTIDVTPDGLELGFAPLA
ncbi:DUF1439 domain-containing protein [Ramlibacter rhizophilus]|uniref:DUF1439 domain-containing protein n=1 Tax=Ramlibacter rhizophilus TaxID=1781167 RepID=A0A4Z0BE20_9BURK|nr:DUF1439 domain-containing protein [Ramlibacter rhizophilus]TFY96931.1 DUF1439 domain-containing protein [Ramlibacter rhizophilus]